ncbi:MAG: DUF4197 domain-containing protein [Gammaproteobacteria bacterium]
MNIKTLAAFALVTCTTSANAGWFSDMFGGSDEIKDKVEEIKDTVKNSSAGDTVKNALSNEDIVAGLKEALNKGAGYAVNNLGKADGFLKNNDVKIPMPDKLEKVESLLRKAGQDKYADEFVTTMNRAAESAVPLTLSVVKEGIANMSIDDAKNILHGPDDAATQYLKKVGSDKLNAQISPIVQDATAKAGVTSMYKNMYGKLGFAGKYLNLEDYNVDSYVTQKTMDGLFTMIAQQ